MKIDNIANDKYWLKYAESSISGALTKINEGAAKLEKLTIWFWSTYTAVVTIGISMSLIKVPPLVLLILASPILSIIITYWYCVRAQLPVYGRYDPRIPYTIKRAFAAGIKLKNKRLRCARYLTLLSALLLSSVLITLSFTDEKSTISYDVFYDSLESIVVVSGIFPEDVIVTTEIDSLDSDLKRITIYQNIYKVKDNEILNLNIPIKPLPQKVIVSTTWIEDAEEKGFTQTLTNKLVAKNAYSYSRKVVEK
jgi:hypothetical protein